MQNLIKQYIDGINIGSAQSYKNLTVFPLVSDYTLDLDYLTLDEALDEDAVDVVELDREGSVPELKVVNKSEQVNFSLEMSGNFTSDQGTIWNDISAKALRMDAESPSSAMSAIYKKKEHSIKDYTGHFSLTGSQIGAVFVINGQFVGMDCFGKPETFGKVFEKLVESYALDAIDTTESEKDPKVEKDQAAKFLQFPAACKVEPHPSVGLGTDCRLESKSITGFALAHDDKILHLSAFSRKGMGSKEKSFTGMIRSSHRRRFRG